MKKKIINNPWILTTGSGILAILGVRFIDSLFGTNLLSIILNSLLFVIKLLINFLKIKIETSVWVLIVGCLMTGGLVFLVLWLLSLKHDSSYREINSEPSFLEYTEDVFSDVLYRWNYKKKIDGNYMIRDISYYCPKCKCSIVGGTCPVCDSNYYSKMKRESVVDALIRHKIEKKKGN